MADTTVAATPAAEKPAVAIPATETPAVEIKTGTEVPADSHAKKAFPPLDPTTFAPQLIWLALAFGALYIALSKWVLPRIGGIIAERHATRQRDLDEAERLKSETDKALKDYEKALADAKGKANSIAETNRNSLKAEIDAERARVEQAIAAKAVDAETRISTGKTKALSQVGAIASETAEHIISELVGLKVTRDEALAAVAAHTSR